MLKYLFVFLGMVPTIGFSRAKSAAPSDQLDEIFFNVSEDVGVPEKLLRGICWVESKFNPTAYNHGDGKGINHAFGICQVLHNTARDFGFKDKNCYRDFRDSSARTYDDCKLFGTYTNIKYAALYLKAKLKTYSGNWEKAAAAYNAGSVFLCKTGKVTRVKDHSIIYKCIPGHILNQRYVDRVMKAIREHR